MRPFQQQKKSTLLLCLQEILYGWISIEEIYFLDILGYLNTILCKQLSAPILFGIPWIYVLGVN